MSGISHIPNIYEYDFKNADRDAEKVKGECTHVFLILQDQIRIEESYNLKLPYKGIISLLKKCGKPVVVAGLGEIVRGLVRILRMSRFIIWRPRRF